MRIGIHSNPCMKILLGCQKSILITAYTLVSTSAHGPGHRLPRLLTSMVDYRNASQDSMRRLINLLYLKAPLHLLWTGLMTASYKVYQSRVDLSKSPDLYLVNVMSISESLFQRLDASKYAVKL